MVVTQADLDKYYRDTRKYQEEHHTEIADAIRYVDGTNKENDMIRAVDFASRIRRMKRPDGEWTGSCCFWDNIPSGCGEDHGLLHLDYKLVNCVSARMKPLDEVVGNGCLCEDNFQYLSPACDHLHGLLHLDYSLVDCTFPYTVLWGWDPDANN